MEREIEEKCMKLLLLQQPVASDLRKISSALKIVTDMERIGIQAGDIGEMILTGETDLSDSQIPLKEMAEETVRMLKDSMKAFERRPGSGQTNDGQRRQSRQPVPGNKKRAVRKTWKGRFRH